MRLTLLVAYLCTRYFLMRRFPLWRIKMKLWNALEETFTHGVDESLSHNLPFKHIFKENAKMSSVQRQKVKKIAVEA